jgi:ribosomal protein RSM22 (predicted rRNA methylase)
MLPDDLRVAVERALAAARPRALSTAVRTLSERYRGHRSDAAFPPLQTELEALAYLAYRLPATFAALSAALQEVRLLQPGLTPQSLLDVGSGPGTTAWSALATFPSINRIVLIERDVRMMQVGQMLAAESHVPALREAEWLRDDVASGIDAGPADLTIASYTIGELSAPTRTRVVLSLWECTAGTCVIVEPGTPEGARRIREAGDTLVQAGAHVIAPFPHDWQCLESAADWCHFAARVPRTRLHRAVKDVALAYEDEKFAYVAASRVPGNPVAGRVIRRPEFRSGHVRLVVCTSRGVERLVIARSQREAFRRARDLRWGSAIEMQEAELFGLT